MLLVSSIVGFFTLGYEHARASVIQQYDPMRDYLMREYGVSSVEELIARYTSQYELSLLDSLKTYGTYADKIPDNVLRYVQPQPSPFRAQSTTSIATPKLKVPTLNEAKETVSKVVYDISDPLVLVALPVLAVPFLALASKRKGKAPTIAVYSVLLIVVALASFRVGVIYAQSTTVTIQPESFTSEVSYIISTDGTTVYARNGRTGQIEFSGTDAGTVIQQVVEVLPEGKIFIKSGDYYAPTLKIIDISKTGIAIEGEVGREGKPVLHNIGFRLTYGWCGLRNLRLVDDTESVGSKGIYINQDASPYGHIQRVTIENVEISKFDYGIINDNVNKAVFGLIIRDVRSECRSGDLWLYYAIPLVEYFKADHANYAQTLDDYAIKIYGTGPLGGGGYLNHVEAMSAKRGIHLMDHLQIWADFLHADSCAGGGITIEKCNESTFRMLRSTLNGAWGLAIGSCEKTDFIEGHINDNQGHGISMGTKPGEPFGCKGVNIIGFQIFNNKLGGIIVYSASSTNYSTDIFVDDCMLVNNGAGTAWANIHAYSPSQIVVGKVICRGGSNIPLGENVTVIGQVISDVGLAKNRGTATITAGQTSVVVPHGLIKTPSSIRVSPRTNLAGRSFWVSNIGSSSFTINISATDTVDHVFDWYAEL
jgi:hypothetical protein